MNRTGGPDRCKARPMSAFSRANPGLAWRRFFVMSVAVGADRRPTRPSPVPGGADRRLNSVLSTSGGADWRPIRIFRRAGGGDRWPIRIFRRPAERIGDRHGVVRRRFARQENFPRVFDGEGGLGRNRSGFPGGRGEGIGRRSGRRDGLPGAGGDFFGNPVGGGRAAGFLEGAGGDRGLLGGRRAGVAEGGERRLAGQEQRGRGAAEGFEALAEVAEIQACGRRPGPWTLGARSTGWLLHRRR